MTSRRERDTITHSGSSRDESYTSEEDLASHSRDYSSSPHDDDWGGEYDELDPEDSASASNHRPSLRSQPRRTHSRRHKLPHRQQSYPFRQAPQPPSVDPSDEYPTAYGGRGGYPPPGPPGPPGPGYYGARGPQPGYPQSTVGGFVPGPYGHGAAQMVPYHHQGYSSNPFAPMSAGSSGASYFGGEARQYDMMPYGHQGYYGHGYGAHHGMPPYGIYPPPPPVTEHPAQARTPAPEERPTKEMVEMKEKLAKFEAEVAAKEAEKKQKEFEDRVRRDAEDTLKRTLEAQRIAQEEAKKEIDKARLEAEEAARRRMEQEKREAEERKKAHEEEMARARREAREKYEAEKRADEDRKKAEAAARAEAEEKARLKFEAEARAAAEKAKKDAEEADRREKAKKLFEEEMKVKAELEARKKLQEEKDAAEKAAADKAKLEADIKAAAESAARKKLDEEKEAEKAKADAEKKKKDDEAALAKKAVEDHQAKETAAAKKAAKAPIRFKDAVGRKFSFPFHLCCTWQGMEDLIRQAFVNIDPVSHHVREGHYDLIGPTGEIILPQVWERVIEPDWAITMELWPFEKREGPGGHPHMGGIPPGFGGRPGHGHRMHGGLPPGMAPPGRRPGGMPPVPPGWNGAPPAPPGGLRPRHPGYPPNVDIMDAKPDKGRKKGSVISWMAGKPAGKSSKTTKK